MSGTAKTFGAGIKLFAKPQYRHHAYWLSAFRDGLKRHGIAAEIHAADQYEPCGLAVFWSHHHAGLIARHDGDYLVMEAGYIDRDRYTSIGFNGLHGEAEFHVEDVPPDRWREKWNPMQPWRETEGDYWLIVGQVHGDAALRGLDVDKWARDIAKQLDGPVYFRPHPRSFQKSELPILGGTLDEDMESAKAVITYTSNAGVDAVLAGIPTVALHPGSMAYPVAAHNLNVYRPDRQRWAEQLAYCQWTHDEISNGTAWAHLRQRYESRSA